MCDLNKEETLSLMPAAAGVQYLLSRREAESQICPTISRTRKPRFMALMQLILAKKVLCCRTVMLLTNFFHLGTVKSMQARNLGFKQIMIFPDSVLTIHVYLRHDDAEWCRKYCLCFDIYLISNDLEQLDSISFEYEIDPSSAGNQAGEEAEERQEGEVDKMIILVVRKFRLPSFMMTNTCQPTASLQLKKRIYIKYITFNFSPQQRGIASHECERILLSKLSEVTPKYLSIEICQI